MIEAAKLAGEILAKVFQLSPLVHHITNYVTANDCANVTLAVGASPVMADCPAEVAEVTAAAQALVLNTGTLNRSRAEAMLLAGKTANSAGIPVVLDPVGVGASKFRGEVVSMLLREVKFCVIRGNASEIRHILHGNSPAKGVDVSQADLADGQFKDTAKTLARNLGCVVAITGAIDVVSDGQMVVSLTNGNDMLASITGTGCMCSSLIGAACSVTHDYLAAACSGILFMSIAGEIAAEYAIQQGNGSFRIALIDEISKLNPAILHKRYSNI